MSSSLTLDKLAEHAAEVMIYFEKHKLLEIVTQLIAEILLERPDDAQLWIARNITRIAHEIYVNCLQISGDTSGEVKFYQLPGKFLHRVVVFGRRGSGRKTQATVLLKRFNLVYIDAEQLIYENLRGTNELAKDLQEAFANQNVHAKSRVLGKIISQRLLQMDALRRGWVLLNYPSNLYEFREVFEHFKIPPNKFVYLQCPALLAKRRLIELPNLGRPQDTVDYMDQEMRYFNKNEAEIEEYLLRRHETIYIDASVCSEAVKTNLLANVERQSYVMGWKNV